MAKQWWNGVGPMPDDEREMLVKVALKTPGMTREKALKTIAILENFNGVDDFGWLMAMQKPAADA